MHKASRMARNLLALPLLLLLQAQRFGPEDCRYWAESYAMVEPVYFAPSAVAAAPVRIVPEAVLSVDVAQVAPQGWMLGAELALPAPGALLYPAGTPLDPDLVDGHWNQCLPGAPAVPPASSLSPRRFASLVRIPCLTDVDGDGAYEAVSVFETNPTMHAPRRELASVLRLPVPVRLVDDPQGLRWHRRHVHRRIRVLNVQDASMQVTVEHAFHDQRPEFGERFVALADGGWAYRLESPGLEPTGAATPVLNYRGRDADSLIVGLTDGAIAEVGGRRFRIARRGPDWTMAPHDDQFQRWIGLECDGRRIAFGAFGPNSRPGSASRR